MLAMRDEPPWNDGRHERLVPGEAVDRPCSHKLTRTPSSRLPGAHLKTILKTPPSAMTHHRFFLSAAALVGLSLVSTPPLFATDITVDTSAGAGQVGGFYGPYDPIVDDPPLAYAPTLPPDNSPTFQNYFLGRSTLGPLSTADTTPERRAFFIFDMAGILGSIPAGHTISSVSIDLELTAGGSAALANFSGDVEIVEFTGTMFGPAEILDPMGTMTPTDAIWDSFGTGTPFGMFAIDGDAPPMAAPASADGTLAMPIGTYTIDLPGAIPELEAAILGGDMFIVTARLATFDPDVIGSSAPPAVDPYEYVFGITDVVSGSGATTAAPLLTISTIPEPSALGALAICLAGFLLPRRRPVTKAH